MVHAIINPTFLQESVYILAGAGHFQQIVYNTIEWFHLTRKIEIREIDIIRHQSNRQCSTKSGQTTGPLTLQTNLFLIVLTSCVFTILFYFCLVTRRKLTKCVLQAYIFQTI